MAAPTIIGRMSELGARIVHVYGLTETYGPYAVSEMCRTKNGASDPKLSWCCAQGATATVEEIIGHVCGQIARYKVPDYVEFVAELPRTATGKIQKFQLRERERQGREYPAQG